MQNPTKIIISTIAAVVLVIGAFVFVQNTNTRFGDVQSYNPLPSTFVSDTGVLCANTSTLLLATSSAGRPFLQISNDSASAVFLGMNSSGIAKVYQGVMIPASTTVSLTPSYLGSIYCISLGSSASTSLSYVN